MDGAKRMSNNIKKCSPATTRKNLDAAKSLASIGVDFVPVPVSALTNKDELISLFCKAMDSLQKEVEKKETQKKLLIKQCPDQHRWYANLIGQHVEYRGDTGTEYRSRETAGYTNFVQYDDAEIVENNNNG
jgi:hypothetical protein